MIFAGRMAIMCWVKCLRSFQDGGVMCWAEMEEVEEGEEN